MTALAQFGPPTSLASASSTCLQPLSGLLIFIYLFCPTCLSAVSLGLGKGTHWGGGLGGCCGIAPQRGWQAAWETERSRKYGGAKCREDGVGTEEEAAKNVIAVKSAGGSPAVKSRVKWRGRRREEKSEWEGRMCLTAGTLRGSWRPCGASR